MDNVITGANSVDEAIGLYKESKTIFNSASMNLREWMTNNESVNQSIPHSDQANESDLKVLGMTWDAKKDVMALQNPKSQKVNVIITKRQVLKEIASVYDPLGFLCPVILRGKVLLQLLWKKHLDWDDVLDEDAKSKWLDIRSDLENVSNVEIKRCIRNKDNVRNYLVCFCDASTVAYACSVYLIQSGHSTTIDLVFAKARLAPVKSMTIPRLELMAALIGARSVNFVKQQLKLKFEQTFIMSDSQCVLHWLNSDKSLPVFVRNRVEEIKLLEDVTFEYVNTTENPADVASRGCSVNELKENQLWWHGPSWLSLPPSNWPKTMIDLKYASPIECESMTAAHEKDTNIGSNKQYPLIMDVNKYPTLLKLKRVTAWCLRFIDKSLKRSVEAGNLQVYELDKAESLWIKCAQHIHFPEAFNSNTNKKCDNLVNQLGVNIDSQAILRCHVLFVFNLCNMSLIIYNVIICAITCLLVLK